MLVLLAGADEALIDLRRMVALVLPGFKARLVQQVDVATRLLVAQLAGQRPLFRAFGRPRNERVED